MSRHLAWKTETVDGVEKKYSIAYGFDRPLQEYFIQVFENGSATEENEDGLIVWEGSRMTHKSNGEMLELFEKWGVPEEHRQAVAMDLPF